MQEHNEAYNNGTSSYAQSLNSLSHLGTEELLKTHTGYVPGSFDGSPSPFNVTRTGRLASPGSWSWLDNPNAIGPVTDQGGGCCTIFAVIGTMESHMRISYGIDTKLSEQEALQCAGGYGGGTNSYVYDYAKNGGTKGADFKVESLNNATREDQEFQARR